MADLVPSDRILDSLSAIVHDRTGGKTHNAVAVVAGADSSVDLTTSGYEWLTLKARMTADAANDLVLSVRGYESDGTTLFDVVVPADVSVAAALAGGVSRAWQRIRLAGAAKVQVRVHNANVADQTATVSYDLQR